MQSLFTDENYERLTTLYVKWPTCLATFFGHAFVICHFNGIARYDSQHTTTFCMTQYEIEIEYFNSAL